VLEAVTQLDLGTELVHCHDWTSGLVPAYLKTELAGIPPYDAIRSLLTIHNIAYQGNFWHWDMELTGIDWKYFNWRQMEFYGNLSILKSGLAFADTLTTVSPRYAQEIQQPPLSCGLEGFRSTAATVRHHQRRGLRWEEPENDPHLGLHTACSPRGQAGLQRRQDEIGRRGRWHWWPWSGVGRPKRFDLVANVPCTRRPMPSG
jgi:starch synthase